MDSKTLLLLIIDDDELIQAVLSRLIQKYGYKYEIAENGLNGIEKVKQETYDLVFLDTVMPKMDGVETLKIIKQIKPELPVVIMSSSAKQTLEEEAKKLNPYRFFLKPFEIKELAEVIEEIAKAKSSTTSK
ncbi:MAG TPA: hypothetical protein DHV62_03330 [Elusimicrobia bacterium]|jgi:CheY-like chemotaxis protein|nr:hypothetical protein [Elusimicrobiota bacterium]